MSIAAIIRDVVKEEDGTVTLLLDPISKTDGPGQSQLTVLNPKPNMESAIGTKIWGGSDEIMVGETKWADRVGYTRIRLV